MKYDKLNNISSESVEKATGKGWDEWVEIIDKEGGREMTHKEIAQMLWDKEYLKNGWWCQMITVGYEYAHNRRTPGQTLTQGFEIGVQKMMQAPQEKLWKFINSSRGKRIWQTDAKIKLRTKKEGERLRMSYNDSVLQITLICNRNTPEKTNVNFHHEKLKNNRERNQMRKHWQKVLESISETVST